MVDAHKLAGRGALRVAAAARELRAQLLVVQDQPVAVVGHLQLVARLHVSGAGEVAADPGGQAHAGVGADGQLRPIQRAQGGVPPVEAGAAVGAQEVSATLILKTPSRAEPCRCTVSPTSNS